MLKHVHSSPYRSTSASFKRSGLASPCNSGASSPLQQRQASNPVLRSSNGSHTSPILCPPKFHSVSGITNSIEAAQVIIQTCEDNPLTSSITSISSAENSNNLSSVSSFQEEPISCRATSEPPLICPKCFKKKKRVIKPTEGDTSASVKIIITQNKPAEINSSEVNIQHSQRASDSSEDLSSPDSPQTSLKCDSCSTHHFDESSPEKKSLFGLSSPVSALLSPSRYERILELDDGISSTSSSPSSRSQSSQSSTSSSGVSSSKSLITKSSKGIKVDHETQLRRRRLDNLSIDSSISDSTSGKEEAVYSFSSSAVLLSDNFKQRTVRVWVRCLMQEMEYKTICVSYGTTCRQVVKQLLSKFRMKHRDPNLFYLAMEVRIRKAGAEVRTCLRLDDTSFPAQLVECHPSEHSRLALRMRRGGLIRVYDKDVAPGSHYKSLLVGEHISANEVICLVLACNKVTENTKNFALYEVWPNEGRETRLGAEDEPMLMANEWEDSSAARFEIRRMSGVIELNSVLENSADNKTSTIFVSQPNTFVETKCDQQKESKRVSSDSDDSTSNVSLTAKETLVEGDDVDGGIFDVKEPERNKPKRMLPHPPEATSTLATNESKPSCCDAETEKGNSDFKTYNDYENYFYI